VIGTLKNGAGNNDSIKTYKGLVVILVNEQTQSSAEYTALALRTAPHAVVMGSQTAGADGDMSFVPFPGGFRSPFSGLGIYYPNGTDTQGVGIVPDIFCLSNPRGNCGGRG
jgi:carboxyl-terminal processing protease